MGKTLLRNTYPDFKVKKMRFKLKSTLLNFSEHGHVAYSDTKLKGMMNRTGNSEFFTIASNCMLNDAQN